MTHEPIEWLLAAIFELRRHSGHRLPATISNARRYTIQWKEAIIAGRLRAGYHCAGKNIVDARDIYCLSVGAVRIDGAVALSMPRTV
jgi:hypothetical protein